MGLTFSKRAFSMRAQDRDATLMLLHRGILLTRYRLSKFHVIPASRSV